MIKFGQGCVMTKKKRSDYKYPNLSREVNLKSRQDYIETDYINGIYDNNGNELMRPMTAEEKEWLDTFYGETIVTSSKKFNPTPETKKLAKRKGKYKAKAAKRKKEIKLKEHENDNKLKYYKKKISDIEECLDFLRKEAGVLNYKSEDQRSLYKDNNTRNDCIYNNLKSRGMLIDLTIENYDSFIAQMWELISTDIYDSQDAMIEEVEKRLRGSFLPESVESYPQDLSDSSDSPDDD